MCSTSSRNPAQPTPSSRALFDSDCCRSEQVCNKSYFVNLLYRRCCQAQTVPCKKCALQLSFGLTNQAVPRNNIYDLFTTKGSKHSENICSGNQLFILHNDTFNHYLTFMSNATKIMSAFFFWGIFLVIVTSYFTSLILPDYYFLFLRVTCFSYTS